MNLVNFYGRVIYDIMTQHGLGQVSRPEIFYFKYFKYFDKAQMFSLNEGCEGIFKNQKFKKH